MSTNKIIEILGDQSDFLLTTPVKPLINRYFTSRHPIPLMKFGCHPIEIPVL